MKIIRGKPAGKPHAIVCTGCGKKTFEAGIAVKDEDVKEGWCAGHDFNGPIVAIEGDYLPLCEECVTVLLRNERIKRDEPA